MACIVTACIVMACIVMAYMAYVHVQLLKELGHPKVQLDFSFIVDEIIKPDSSRAGDYAWEDAGDDQQRQQRCWARL